MSQQSTECFLRFFLNMTEILKLNEIKRIVSARGTYDIIDWKIEKVSEKIIGYLGEHLKLIITVVGADGAESNMKLFIKCIPRDDDLKAQYINECNFFKREYVALSKIFPQFEGDHGDKKWRPEALLLKEDLCVFEDVTELGYRMPHCQETMQFEEIKAVVISISRFHAQTFIVEEKKSKKLNRSYRLWEDYKLFLQESLRGQIWRNIGRDAVIEYLKVYSKYISKPNFDVIINKAITKLFDDAEALMMPSSKYRNAIVHRDLWTNNIFLKSTDFSVQALIVDFQTVLYCPPMLDLTSLLYFNTDLEFRNKFTEILLDLYYTVLTDELGNHNIMIDEILDKQTLQQSYEDNVLFGITQASLIIPLTVMDDRTKDKLFGNPDTYHKITSKSRHEELIEVAANDGMYRRRITELFDELIDKYIDLNV